MPTLTKIRGRKQPAILKKTSVSLVGDALVLLAFDNAAQANIITIASNGKIIMANNAACKLLGYSRKEILTKTRATIFNTRENNFKKMLKQREEEGKSFASVIAIKKSGAPLPCEITSAVFKNAMGIKNAITTITDMRPHISRQKDIDTGKERIITRAVVKQKNIDSKREKAFAPGIEEAIGRLGVAEAKNQEIWKKQVSKVSYDVMWDWNIVTGQVYVGDSLQEVFGYKVQNNTVSCADVTACLLDGEKQAIRKKLLVVLISGKKSWRDSFRFERKNGSVAFVTCRAMIIRNGQGKAVHLIGAIHDISEIQELKDKLDQEIAVHDEDKKIFEQASRLSFDGIWDWNLVTNEFFLGEGFVEIFGPAVDNKESLAFDWAKYLHPADREAVEKGLSDAIASPGTYWEQTYRFIKTDGTIANVSGRANIIRDADGKASRLIGVIHDCTRQQELEAQLDREISDKGNMLTEHTENFRLIFNSSSDILFDNDLLTDKLIISNAYETEFGYKLSGNMTMEKDWLTYIHPDDQAGVADDYATMLASNEIEWKYAYRFIKADQSVVNIVSNRIILRRTGGKAYRMIGSMQDVSKQMVLEEKLELEIKLKEKQIAEASEDAKDTERSNIGRELHDNINQLLGASRMFLEMAKRGGKSSAAHLSRSSEYTLTAIEEIRKLTKGLTTDIIKNLGLRIAIEKLAGDMKEISPVKISCTLSTFKEDSVDEKFKLNLFRIIQEQVNNILKHASAKKVAITLSQNNKNIRLTISDDGVGFDTGKKQNGIGLANMKIRTGAYNGNTVLISEPGKGCVLNVTFPVVNGR